jgi:hypothetical protein
VVGLGALFQLEIVHDRARGVRKHRPFLLGLVQLEVGVDDAARHGVAPAAIHHQVPVGRDRGTGLELILQIVVLAVADVPAAQVNGGSGGVVQFDVVLVLTEVVGVVAPIRGGHLVHHHLGERGSDKGQ